MNRNVQVHLALFTVSALYGATFTIAKEVMNGYVGASAFIVIRVATAALLFLIFHSLFIREKVTHRPDLLRMSVCSIFGVGLNMLLFFNGLKLTTPINGAVLMTCTPIFVVIFAAWLLREKITLLRGGGVLLAASGAALLIGGTRFDFSSSTAYGDLMVTINAIIYSFYLVYAKPLMQKYHPFTVSKWTFLAGTLLVLPFGYEQLAEVSWSAMPPKIALYIVFVAVGTTFLTYLLNAWALRHATPSLVGSYIYLQPVLATVIAILSQRDELTIAKFSFTMLIFAGVYLVSKTPQQHA
jgi:drug/metabolite transporter (DMT)-like permease